MASPPDWFVNRETGAVVHVEGQSKLTQTTADKIGAGDAKKYDRLGADNMFGNNNEKANNIRELGASVVENPEIFMEKQGYEKSEKVNIKEREFVSGGAMGEEKISSTITDMKQIGDSKVTYAKPEQMNEKKVLAETSGQSSWSSSRSTTYTLTKPVGQDNSKTAEYYGNKHTDYGTGLKILDTFIQLAQGVIQSMKK